MRVCGRLISKHLALARDGQVEYYRIVVAEERGYEAELIKISVYDDNVMKVITTTPLQSGVIVDTYKSSSGYRNALKVELVTLLSCPICFNFTIDDGDDAQKPCETCHKQGALERIKGEWTVKSKKDFISTSQQDQLQLEEAAKRMLLEQDGNLLGYVTFPKTPFFEELSNTVIGGMIELTGWRDDLRHTKLINVVVSNPHDLKDVLACDLCTRIFKNRGLLKYHRASHHKMKKVSS